MIANPTVYSVSDINTYIKSKLTNDSALKHLTIRGEISNFKVYPLGHAYFSLKDQQSVISVVMFSNYVSKLNFSPKNGDDVMINAAIDVYVARGNYQLVCYEMEEIGRGNILVELEKLKKKLKEEGLFDESRKRSINLFPKAVGVITAPNGAAIKDIVTNLKRRYPVADIYVFPSTVQGENAPKELLLAFLESQKYDLDTLIIGRGGGSSEDLSAFNDEKLVRAIAQSKMPVIAAVGHEIDSTLVDFVADKRASTPTGAAEFATIDRREVEQRFDDFYITSEQILHSKLTEQNDTLEEINENLNAAICEKMENLKELLSHSRELLESFNPSKVLNRGYSIISDQEGKIISSVKTIKIGQEITTILKDGQIISKVLKEKK